LASPETLINKSNSKLDLDDIDKGWACVAANAVKKAAADYARELGKGLNKDEAMERCSQSRFIAAKLHTIGYVSIACRRGWELDADLDPHEQIFRMVKQAAETYATGPEKDVLVLNAKLYGLWQVEEQGAWFLKC
jgi:acyl-CoA oxidase